ncbi:hypothetical protein TREES_T100021038 [Tupaia chinensis]|uniref:Uncharacterized protein n=1 Tax=Tupaia chinensis TaxID=246437 RepID=L9JB58_TUPCH|nr:hypothetical protein TREES_T100021038 [Tupaia chinensis]
MPQPAAAVLAWLLHESLRVRQGTGPGKPRSSPGPATQPANLRAEKETDKEHLDRKSLEYGQWKRGRRGRPDVLVSGLRGARDKPPRPEWNLPGRSERLAGVSAQTTTTLARAALLPAALPPSTLWKQKFLETLTAPPRCSQALLKSQGQEGHCSSGGEELVCVSLQPMDVGATGPGPDPTEPRPLLQEARLPCTLPCGGAQPLLLRWLSGVLEVLLASKLVVPLPLAVTCARGISVRATADVAGHRRVAAKHGGSRARLPVHFRTFGHPERTLLSFRSRLNCRSPPRPELVGSELAQRPPGPFAGLRLLQVLLLRSFHIQPHTSKALLYPSPLGNVCLPVYTRFQSSGCAGHSPLEAPPEPKPPAPPPSWAVPVMHSRGLVPSTPSADTPTHSGPSYETQRRHGPQGHSPTWLQAALPRKASRSVRTLATQTVLSPEDLGDAFPGLPSGARSRAESLEPQAASRARYQGCAVPCLPALPSEPREKPVCSHGHVVPAGALLCTHGKQQPAGFSRLSAPRDEGPGLQVCLGHAARALVCEETVLPGRNHDNHSITREKLLRVWGCQFRQQNHTLTGAGSTPAGAVHLNTRTEVSKQGQPEGDRGPQAAKMAGSWGRSSALAKALLRMNTALLLNRTPGTTPSRVEGGHNFAIRRHLRWLTVKWHRNPSSGHRVGMPGQLLAGRFRGMGPWHAYTNSLARSVR